MTQVPVVEVGILDPEGALAPFTLNFYGVPFEEFMTTPGGGWRVRQALERRGLHDYVSSPFLVHRVHYARPAPGRAPPEPETPPPPQDPIDLALTRQEYRSARRSLR